MGLNVALLNCVALPAGSHSTFTPTICIEASPDVITTGLGTVREGDGYTAHNSGPTVHGRPTQGSVSGTVFANSLGVGRVTDTTDCGNIIAAGFAPTVFAGG